MSVGHMAAEDHGFINDWKSRKIYKKWEGIKHDRKVSLQFNSKNQAEWHIPGDFSKLWRSGL